MIVYTFVCIFNIKSEGEDEVFEICVKKDHRFVWKLLTLELNEWS